MGKDMKISVNRVEPGTIIRHRRILGPILFGRKNTHMVY